MDDCSKRGRLIGLMQAINAVCNPLTIALKCYAVIWPRAVTFRPCLRMRRRPAFTQPNNNVIFARGSFAAANCICLALRPGGAPA
jgi:hypothetical protein